MNLADSDHRLARFVGNLSLMLRLSLLIREFARLSGKSIDARIGAVLDWSELEPLRDRKLLLERLQNAVLELKPPVLEKKVPFPRLEIRRAA